jgi:hypothetical protein
MARMFVEIMRDMLVMMVLVVLAMAMVKTTRRFDIPLHIIICILWCNFHFIISLQFFMVFEIDVHVIQTK